MARRRHDNDQLRSQSDQTSTQVTSSLQRKHSALSRRLLYYGSIKNQSPAHVRPKKAMITDSLIHPRNQGILKDYFPGVVISTTHLSPKMVFQQQMKRSRSKKVAPDSTVFTTSWLMDQPVRNTGSPSKQSIVARASSQSAAPFTQKYFVKLSKRLRSASPQF